MTFFSPSRILPIEPRVLLGYQPGSENRLKRALRSLGEKGKAGGTAFRYISERPVSIFSIVLIVLAVFLFLDQILFLLSGCWLLAVSR